MQPIGVPCIVASRPAARADGVSRRRHDVVQVVYDVAERLLLLASRPARIEAMKKG
jgi:hypothetical protein